MEQTSLESFRAKVKKPSKETEEELSASKNQKALNRQYHECYLQYGFIATVLPCYIVYHNLYAVKMIAS